MKSLQAEFPQRLSLAQRLLPRRPSYFLLGKKIYFILNSRARSGKISEIIQKLSKHFPLYSFNVVLSSGTQVSTDLTREVLSDSSLFIVMGGDGTANNAIQYLVSSPATFALIPRGTANDLAQEFRIPTQLEEALEVIFQGEVRKLDTVKVNAHHILTIGSIGFPAFVAETVNQFKSRNIFNRFVHRFILRSAIYKFFAFLLFFFGSERNFRKRMKLFIDSIPVFEGEAVALFFGKQEILGKGFRPCPGVNADSPYFCVSLLPFISRFQLFKDMQNLSAGHPEKIPHFKVWNANEFKVQSESFENLLGDGEILDWDDEFIGKRIPEAVRFVVPKKPKAAKL